MGGGYDDYLYEILILLYDPLVVSYSFTLASLAQNTLAGR